MKNILLPVIFIILVLTNLLSGQSEQQNAALEQKIRNLEQSEVDALLRNDLTTMEKLWAKDYTVNNPRNEVGKASEGPIRAGIRIYSSFVREVERVLIHENTVIVMGRETVVPKGDASDAGQTIRRRFTNIWMNRNGEWLLTARHANVICKD